MRILDFEVKDALRLYNVKRWGVVEMSKEQSVAEHSFNVSLLCIAILNQAETVWEHKSQISDLKADTLRWAALHDIPELLTGDIPTSFKRQLPAITAIEYKICPLYAGEADHMSRSVAGTIVKIADKLEAIMYMDKFCIDDRKDALLAEMRLEGIDILRGPLAEDVALMVCRAGLDAHLMRHTYD